jgi:hypothetical protein
MNYTEIVQRVSSIATCDEKELTQVLEEALEKVSCFEKVNSELIKAEGVFNFYKYENQVLLKKYANNVKELAKIAPQKFMEITGGMTFSELDLEVNKRLGPPSFWGNVAIKIWGAHPGAYGGSKARLHKPSNMKIFLNSYAKEAEELKPVLNKAAIEVEGSAVMLIPPDYRYSLAIETMLRLVKNLRASTWKECANLYEDQLSKWKIEAKSEESLRLQREIRNLTGAAANSAKAAAIFSGLNLLLK